MSTLSKALMLTLLASTTAAALASETATYTYDAKGRLVRVVKTGTVNNGVTTTYQHDKADNRVRVQTTGSANAPSS